MPRPINSNTVLKVMKLIHKVFPIPEDVSFKGTHAFTIYEDGRLCLTVWSKSAKTIRCYPVIFETETFTEKSLTKIRDEIDKQNVIEDEKLSKAEISV